MRYCELGPCGGHIAKFDNCLAEALYELGTDYAEEHCGNAIDWDGYAMLFCFDKSHRVKAGDWSGMFAFTISAGTYVIIHTAPSGAVTMTGYLTREEAQEAYDEFEREYALWSERQESYV